MVFVRAYTLWPSAKPVCRGQTEKETPMISQRLALAAGLAILTGAVNVPVHAKIVSNGLARNALNTEAVTHSAATPNGSAIAELNGVAVEAVTLPAGRAH
jgi:hypothetical protein